MTTIIQQLNHYNPVAKTRFFTVAVLVQLPALIFNSMMPNWAPMVAIAGLVVLFLLRSAVIGRLIGHTPIDWPLLLLLILVLAIGLQTTLDLRVTLPQTYALIGNLAILWVMAAQRNAFWLRQSGWLLLLAGLILAIIALLFTNFTYAKFPFIGQSIYELLPDGLNGFWGQQRLDPNHVGGLLALFWMPAVVLIWLGDSWQQRDVAKVVVVVLLVLLVLTQSRGALFGCVMALLVITLLYDRRWLLFWLTVIMALIFAIYQIGPNTAEEMIFRQGDAANDPSLLSRQELWMLAITLIYEFPLTGVGLGVIDSQILLDPDIKNVHNLYLQTGAEMGLPGLIGHLSIYIITCFLLLRQAVHRHTNGYQAVALGLLGSLIIFLTHGLIEAITTSPQIAIVVWGLLGLMVAVATSSSK